MHSSMAASRQKIITFISYSSSFSSSTTHLKSFLNQTLRFKTSSSSSTFLSSPLDHQNQHEFSTPCEFLGSWNPTNDPREAEAKLVQLRRDYAKQVKELRKEYLYEMDLQRQEKQRKDEAKREAIRVAKEERKVAKAVMAKARAAERMVVEEEFRKTLLKEQEQNLENWRLKEKGRKRRTKRVTSCVGKVPHGSVILIWRRRFWRQLLTAQAYESITSNSLHRFSDPKYGSKHQI